MASIVNAAPACDCSDVRPRVTHDGPPLPFNCNEQRRFGKCEEPFMFDTIVELQAGYCQISCGRCSCCSTMGELATSLGLDDMLVLMDVAGIDATEFRSNPGWMSSILIPQPGAFGHWLATQGWTVESILASETQRQILQETINLHILPPVQPLNALWTSPFFLSGTKIPTAAEGLPPLSVFRIGDSVVLAGLHNTVELVEGDHEFCKGFIHIVDDVLQAAAVVVGSETVELVSAEPSLPAAPADLQTPEEQGTSTPDLAPDEAAGQVTTAQEPPATESPGAAEATEVPAPSEAALPILAQQPTQGVSTPVEPAALEPGTVVADVEAEEAIASIEPVPPVSLPTPNPASAPLKPPTTEAAESTQVPRPPAEPAPSSTGSTEVNVVTIDPNLVG